MPTTARTRKPDRSNGTKPSAIAAQTPTPALREGIWMTRIGCVLCFRDGGVRAHQAAHLFPPEEIDLVDSMSLNKVIIHHATHAEAALRPVTTRP